MSDKTLDQLITSLKTEAIDAAEKECEEILNKAKLEAQQIIKAAENKRDDLLADAQQEAQAIIDKGEASLRQAGRDYSISVRNELIEMFDAVLKAEVNKEFSPELLKSTIIKVIENIGGDVDVRLSSENSKELAEYIHARLQSTDQIASIVEDNTVLKGFSISHKTEGWSYDITPEEVAESLRAHLNTNWLNILKKEE
jgi:V/A-type H+-transporting ATPase subunit E